MTSSVLKFHFTYQVPDEVLMPEQTWADKAAYKAKAIELANEFKANFKKFDSVSEDIINLGGPIA